MPYMGDPRENAIDIDNHVIWEADNRIEERYEWNAALIDLCDMTPEEYMKNPIIEAIEGGGGGTTTTTAPPGPTPSGNDITFYYLSINRMVDSDTLSLSDFTERTEPKDTTFELDLVLGNPTDADIQYLIDQGFSDEAREEIMERRANSFYFVVPDEYNTSSKMSLECSGFPVDENTIVRGFTINGAPSGYSAFKVDNTANFNPNWDVDVNVYITYNIRFIAS